MKKSKALEGIRESLRTNLHCQLKLVFDPSLPDERHIVEMLYQNRMKIRELEENESALTILLEIEQMKVVWKN